MSGTKRWAVAVLLAGIIGLVGTADYEDEVLQEEHYAEMVCAGHWPDFNDTLPACE
mgnify:FL=1